MKPASVIPCVQSGGLPSSIDTNRYTGHLASFKTHVCLVEVLMESQYLLYSATPPVDYVVMANLAADMARIQYV